MVNIQRTLMCACTALNNSLYLASGRVMRKVRSVPALLITVAGYRLLRRLRPPRRPSSPRNRPATAEETAPICRVAGARPIRLGAGWPRGTEWEAETEGSWAERRWQRLHLPGLYERSLRVACASRPPWHGTRGFESPKLHGKSASQSIFDLERHKIALCDREHPGLMDAVRPRSAASSHPCWGRARCQHVKPFSSNAFA